MKNFVIQRNIQRYHKQLEFESDEGRRQMLLVLLAEEEAKDLVAAKADLPPPKCQRTARSAHGA